MMLFFLRVSVAVVLLVFIAAAWGLGVDIICSTSSVVIQGTVLAVNCALTLAGVGTIDAIAALNATNQG